MPSMNHASPNFNLTSGSNLGAMEIATFISLVLCGIGVAQGYSYYHQFTTDRPFLKVMVGTVLALEVSHSIATAYAIYDFTITLTATAVKTPNSYVLSTTVLLEILITTIVQSFFAYRIRSLSGNLYASSLCWILCFLRFLGGIALAVKSFLDVSRESSLDVPDDFALEETFGWLITSVLSVGAAVDLTIAASLCYYFNRLRSPVTIRRMAQILDRLISWTIQTGLVTSMTSVSSVICFQALKDNCECIPMTDATYLSVWSRGHMVCNLHRSREAVLQFPPPVVSLRPAVELDLRNDRQAERPDGQSSTADHEQV